MIIKKQDNKKIINDFEEYIDNVKMIKNIIKYN